VFATHRRPDPEAPQLDLSGAFASMREVRLDRHRAEIAFHEGKGLHASGAQVSLS
jgi:hypothetical protein